MTRWSVAVDRTSIDSSCNVYLGYGYVYVVGRTPKIVNISAMVIDDVIDFFYLDVLVVHYAWRRDVACTAT